MTGLAAKYQILYYHMITTPVKGKLGEVPSNLVRMSAVLAR